jgi:hypothetical protein
MVTPKGIMSTEGETLQVSVLLDMCTLGDAADVNPVIKFLRLVPGYCTAGVRNPRGTHE